MKHGTCSDMRTEDAYFGTVLKIFEGGLNFGDVLDKAGIRPSSTDTYTVSCEICCVRTLYGYDDNNQGSCL